MASKQNVFKKVKKDGKAVFDGPKVKDRKKSAPPTQTHKKKKGAGSYSRKKEMDEDEEKSCWDGYKKEGTKKKGGKTVNNCVKENNNISMLIDAILEKRYSDADKYLKDVVEGKLQRRIQEELTTPLF
jgi:hypothetical protein